jgi:alanine or glycine:cation symporter, AGCS family
VAGPGSLFSAGIFVNALSAASLLQAHTVGRSFLASYGTNPYLVAGVMTLVTAMVVIGGVRRIGQVSEGLVPFMSLVYVAAGLLLFLVSWRSIPQCSGPSSPTPSPRSQPWEGSQGPPSCRRSRRG